MKTKTCETCGKRPARYVCQECGRNVCEQCLEPHTWLCSECIGRVGQEIPRLEAEGISPSRSLFMKVFFLGFILIFAGMVFLMVATLLYGIPGSMGLVIFIGPIPIILGAGEYSFLAVVLAIILTILGVAFFIILRNQK